jgi:hypothetical protein
MKVPVIGVMHARAIGSVTTALTAAGTPDLAHERQVAARERCGPGVGNGRGETSSGQARE